MQKKNKKKLLLARLLFVILLIVANSFAWFIFATRATTDVSVHVRGWNVILKNGDQEVSDFITINIDSLYPGMDDYLYELEINNHSEIGANVVYEIYEARIMDTNYISREGRYALGQSALSTDMTSSQLIDHLKTQYPFKFDFILTNSSVSQDNGKEYFKLTVKWPFESNDDETDTLWGIKASQYKSSNPTNPSIALKIRIVVTQAN